MKVAGGKRAVNLHDTVYPIGVVFLCVQGKRACGSHEKRRDDNGGEARGLMGDTHSCSSSRSSPSFYLFSPFDKSAKVATHSPRHPPPLPPSLPLPSTGDFLFLAGLVFIIGMQRTVRLFTKRDRAPGIICFFLGILLVFVRYVLRGDGRGGGDD